MYDFALTFLLGVWVGVMVLWLLQVWFEGKKDDLTVGLMIGFGSSLVLWSGVIAWLVSRR